MKHDFFDLLTNSPQTFGECVQSLAKGRSINYATQKSRISRPQSRGHDIIGALHRHPLA